MRGWRHTAGLLLTLLAGAAGPAAAQDAVTNYPIFISCGCASQNCPTPFVVDVDAGGGLEVGYSVGQHCSPVRVDIFVDGNHVLASPYMAWSDQSESQPEPTTTGMIDVSHALGPGLTHRVEVHATGAVGGCNSGVLCTWAGTLHVKPTCPDDGQHRCTQNPELPSVTLGRKFSLEVAPPCPGGGKLGTELEVELSGGEVGASCVNRCQGETIARGEVKASFHDCRSAKFVTAGLDFSRKVQQCLGRDEVLCQEACNPDKSCTTNEVTGSVHGGVEFNGEGTIGAEAPGASLSAQARCGVKVGFGLSASITVKDVINQDACGDCEACSDIRGTLSGSSSSSFSCQLSLFAGYKKFDIGGCEDCLKAQVSLSGTGQTLQGACGNKKCFLSTFGLTSTIQSPSVCVNTFGRKRKFLLQGSGNLTHTVNSCGGNNPEGWDRNSNVMLKDDGDC